MPYKERDEENGLYYYGACYYAPWLARWSSCDPAGSADEVNVYSYARCRPLVAIDPSGYQTSLPEETPHVIIPSYATGEETQPKKSA